MSHLPLLEVTGLSKHYILKGGIFAGQKQCLKAVDRVSFAIREGETLGLVGESGCGKTTTGRMLMRLIQPTAGQILMLDEGRQVDLGLLDGEPLRLFRRHIQMVFQDPYSSLNPRMRVGELLAEPVRALLPQMSDKEVKDRVHWVAEAVGLKSEQMGRYPHAFSGGQRQRICIARALVVRPRLIVCDEPVSALDVSVRAQIINLLKDLQQEFGLTYLFIAHDLAVVENISTRIAVMYAGRIVETADTDILYSNPRHPYTAALLRAIPDPDPARRFDAGFTIREQAEDAKDFGGCAFYSRCPVAMDICRSNNPDLLAAGEGQFAACHLVAETETSCASVEKPAPASQGLQLMQDGTTT